MPRQRIDHSRKVYVVPDDFPELLKRFMEEGDMSQAEMARRLGPYPYTVKRWTKNGVRPHYQYQMAMLDLADDLGLAHPLTAWTLPDEERGEKPAKAVPPRCRSDRRKASHRRRGFDGADANGRRGTEHP